MTRRIHAIPWALSGGSLLLLAAAPPSAPEARFTDVTDAVGIDFKHENSPTSSKYLVETMGGGVGLADFTGSGNLDIFLLNGGETPGGKSAEVLRNALYRTLGNGKFEDVAAEARVDKLTNYGMGVAIADFDNDGLLDLLFVNGNVYPEVEKLFAEYPYKNPRLVLRNTGRGRF